MANKVTLKQIAQEVGLSPSSVSLVLNNRPCRISEENRKLIKEVAARNHYVPNQIARSLVISNAAGGVNTQFLVGDLMIITDHINLFPEHPLRGKNIDELGPRFPGMTDAYSPRIIRLAEECGKKLGIPLQHGVYAGLQGPSFETPAEYNWIRVIGGDAVGMSTVPEIIVARHMGMECFGMSVITNSTASPELIKTNHTEVQDIGNTAQPRMTALFREIIAELES